MIPDFAPTQPEKPHETNHAAVIDLRVQSGQRRELDVQASPGRVAVRWSGEKVERVAAGLSLLVAAIVLLVGLARYPAQVTPDEVYPSLRAVELIENDFNGEDGALLPAFLPGSTPFGIGTNAYLQVLPQLLRPNSLIWIRACNAILALLASLLLAYWMRIGLRIKYAWLLPLLLAGVPAWFTFARSGLDITLAVSLLTATLACYGLYRAGRERWIFAAVALAWLGFYAHPVVRLAVPTAVVLLTAVDWRYHWSRRRVLIKALILAAVMAIPLVIFLLRHPGGMAQELAAAGSYLVSDAIGWQKAGKFVLAMLQAANPFSWLLVDPYLAAGYRTGPFPPLPILLFPFVILGGWRAVKRINQAGYRLLWFGLLAAAVGAAPFGGTLPASLLAVPLLAGLAIVGLGVALDWLQRKWKRMPDWLSVAALLSALSAGSLLLLVSALNPGPRWQLDYGREGLQYGAPQIYAAASEYIASHPERSVLVWPEWSSDPEALRRFFSPGLREKVNSGMLDTYLYQREPGIEQLAFVLPDDQYQAAMASGKFYTTTVESIAYPDGQAAFHLVELVYTPQFEAVVATETEQRHALVRALVTIDGETVTVLHTALDIGAPVNLFDGQNASLVRSAAANPLVIELHFSAPRSIRGVTLDLGAEPITVTVAATLGDGSTRAYTQNSAASDGMKQTRIEFEGSLQVEKLRLEVLDDSVGDPAHVHLWEITLHE